MERSKTEIGEPWVERDGEGRITKRRERDEWNG